MKPLIIGIAGGTGSGKTTLVDRLLEQFGDDISVLPHDNYYAAHHDLSLEQRQTLNYDHPASFDTDRMIQDLQDLRAGKTIHCPVYDYAIHDRTEETRELKPNKVILVTTRSAFSGVIFTYVVLVPFSSITSTIGSNWQMPMQPVCVTRTS